MAITKRLGQTRRGPFAQIRSRRMRGLLIVLVVAVAALGTYGIVQAAPTIVATMSDAFIGGDGDGKDSPRTHSLLPSGEIARFGPGAEPPRAAARLIGELYLQGLLL